MHAYITIKRRPILQEALEEKLRGMGCDPFTVYGDFDMMVESESDNPEILYERVMRPLVFIEGVTCRLWISLETCSIVTDDPTHAYVLIEVKPKNCVDKVYESLKGIVGVKRVSIVAGDYDIIAKVGSKDDVDYKRVLKDIWAVEGVEHTCSCTRSTTSYKFGQKTQEGTGSRTTL